MSPFDIGFVIIVIIFSAVIHELMHGVAADRLGDPTARYAGRLTVNPLKHIELFGSIILPILSSFTGFFFGWAKPVPYNPYNFNKLIRWAEAIVAFAGPASNLVIAGLAGVVYRAGVSAELAPLVMYIIAINCSLFILNMLPIPPLDGSKILASILPHGPLADAYDRFRALFEQNFALGLILVLVLINVFGGIYGSAVFGLAGIIAGI